MLKIAVKHLHHTYYRLPTMKVKQAPFVMYASLKEAAVRKGDRYVALAVNL